MKRTFLSLLVFTFLFLLSSCGGSKAVSLMSLLGGKSFNVESIMGKAIDLSQFAKGAPIFNFGTDGGLTGNSGCNNFTGQFKVDGSKLALDPGAMTRMACPGNGEQQFLDAVKQVTGAKADGNKIKLMNGATEIMSLVPKL